MSISYDQRVEVEPSALDIAPVAGRIGAEIRNLSLSADLDDATISAIRTALVTHKVIFFRAQHHLDDAGQEAFAARMGEPIRQPTAAARPEDSGFLLDMKAKEGYASSLWHTDMTFLAAYPEASILRSLVAPVSGGDTVWANTAAAYRGLPEPLRILADNLKAIHGNTTDFDEQYEESVQEKMGDMRHRKAPKLFQAEHPVVAVHPETGERSLLLGHSFVKRFVGLTSDDSHRLLAIFQDHVTKPENTVRWRWQPGDVAIWDNRSTQHRSVPDFGDQPRHMRRVTIRGARATGVDGVASRQVKFEQMAATA